MKASAGRWLVQITEHKVTRILVWIYLLYLATCVVFITPLINWAGSALYQQHTGRELHYSLITFNPFTLALTLHHPNDKNPDGSLFWSAQRLQANPSLLQSVFRFAPTLDALELTGLRAEIQKSPANGWNFSDILEHQTALSKKDKPTPTTEMEIPPLVINRIGFTIHTIQFTDTTQEDIFHTSVDDIDFAWENFSTIKEAGQPYYLHARSNGGELVWRGTVSVKRGLSEGELSVKNISLKPIWQYFKPYVNFNLRDAAVSFAGRYQLDWHNSLRWALSEGRIAVANLDIHSRKKNVTRSLLTFDAVVLDGVKISSDTQLLVIDNVSVDDLGVKSWSKGAQVGLVDMLMPNMPASENIQDDGALEESPSWAAEIKSIKINAADIQWQVAELRDHPFSITPLDLTLADVHTRGDLAAQFHLNAHIDKQTTLEIAGEINPASLTGAFDTTIKKLPLQIINPLLQPHLNAEILSGYLDTQTQLQITEGAPAHILSNGNLAQFTLRPLSAPQEILTWKNLAWHNTQVNMAEQQLDIPLVELAGFDSQLIITKEGTTNLQMLFPDVMPSTTDPVPAHTVTEDEKPWQFLLQKFVLDNASFRFHDESLTPDFTAAVQRFNGELVGLSSEPKKLASFNFKGDVDGYAPVTLQGKTQPFLSDPQLDAVLNFENLDLGGFSTYSSTYAGWRIDRGLLTANLYYRLADGHILGDNHIVMDQLQLGDRVKSTGAMDIPLRLALALLTDEHGVATLDVGISGRPDDPAFDISAVIWAAVRNTLMKVVTAPFNLLANLVGADEDLGAIKFNSGSTQLLSNATRKLHLLEEALNKRPQLRLEARGQYDAVTDTRGLRAAQAKVIFLEQGLTNNDIKKKTPAWQKVVAGEYRKLDLPKVKELTPEQQYDALLNTFVVTTDDLRRLAVERSIVTKQFLVEHLHVNNDRILINAEIDCSKQKACASRTVVFDLSDLSQ